MGFSLSRALAGAVVGGAHAAGDVFSDQLAEAAKDRARVADEERAFRVAEHADSLVAAREARKQEMLDVKEKEKRKLYSDTVQGEIAALKEKGVAIGGVEGQTAIADAFAKAGYPEFANTYYDNAQKARDADDKKELRKIQLANAAATSAAARQGRTDAQEAKIEQRKAADEAKLFRYAEGQGGRLQTFDTEANAFKPYGAGANYAAQIVHDGLAANKDHAEIREAVTKYVNVTDAAFRSPAYKGQDPSVVANKTLSDYRAKWLAPEKPVAEEKPSGQSTQPPTAAEKKVIPPVFGGNNEPVQKTAPPTVGLQTWRDKAGNTLPYKPADTIDLITPGVSWRNSGAK